MYELRQYSYNNAQIKDVIFEMKKNSSLWKWFLKSFANQDHQCYQILL